MREYTHSSYYISTDTLQYIYVSAKITINQLVLSVTYGQNEVKPFPEHATSFVLLPQVRCKTTYSLRFSRRAEVGLCNPEAWRCR